MSDNEYLQHIKLHFTSSLDLLFKVKDGHNLDSERFVQCCLAIMTFTKNNQWCIWVKQISIYIQPLKIKYFDDHPILCEIGSVSPSYIFERFLLFKCLKLSNIEVSDIMLIFTVKIYCQNGDWPTVHIAKCLG
jgi:hypothetical protein